MKPTRLKNYLIILMSVFFLALPTFAQNAGKIPVIFDTDCNNELDDQHALAYLLFNSDVFNTIGVTVNNTVSGGGIDGQYEEALRVMKLSEADGIIPLFKGAHNDYNDIKNNINNPQFDGYEAVDFIIQQARAIQGEKLILLPVGKLTNIALAFLKAPDIISKVKVVWLGSNYPHSGEYNLANDVPSVNAVIATGVEFEMALVHSSNGTSTVVAKLADIRNIMPGKGPRIASPITGRHGGLFSTFGDYSVDLFNHVNTNRSMYDMAAVAVVKNPDFATLETIPAPRLIGTSWDLQLDNAKTIKIWKNFDKDAIMADFYNSMTDYQLVGQGKPRAKFTSSKTNSSVNFNAATSFIPEGRTAEYSWNFGDGSSATGVNVNHTYSAQGIYTVVLTVTDSTGEVNSTSASIAVSSGIANNSSDDQVNLALLPSAILSGSATNGRGTPGEILFDPKKNDYAYKSSWNEYGVSYGANLGRPSADEGFSWQVSWPIPKKVNYITFGGAYANQPQTNTVWKVSYLLDGTWTVISQGTGGWIHGGIFEWGGLNQAPVTAEAVRVQVYSDGNSDLVSIHLRARGGYSNNIDDHNTNPKATLIQYIGDVAEEWTPDNVPAANINLGLLPGVTISGNIEGFSTNLRGSIYQVMYDPFANEYVEKGDWNEYGVGFNENLGKLSEEDAFTWQLEWDVPKFVNYITFGGSYPNQPQPNTMWKVQYRNEAGWQTLDSGKGGWIDQGIFEWNGVSLDPLIIDGLRVLLYSDGVNDLKSIHLRGRGGESHNINDSSTNPKASVVLFLEPEVQDTSVSFDFPEEGGEVFIGEEVIFSVDTSRIDSEIDYVELLLNGVAVHKSPDSLTTLNWRAIYPGNLSLSVKVVDVNGNSFISATKSLSVNLDIIPQNQAQSDVTLTLVSDAVLFGNAVQFDKGVRGSKGEILFDPSVQDYALTADWNEYGVGFQQNLGKVSENDAFKVEFTWNSSKYVNYITFGGCYPNQPQPNTMWKVQALIANEWIDLDSGKGGWINNGTFSWGGKAHPEIAADGIRVLLYSDGINDLKSIH
ncbi:MAG: nucleoside hydrolase, partial [Lentisphaeraceae bacterium]|nr:nucleoside hydrolase [Lentisphaeraceae bacterium]